MQKYIGGIEGFLEQDAAKESAFWADYQVLGPMFAALRMFMTMDDVLTVIVGAKGCAYHLNFTIVAWGEIDFFLGKRPLPVLEYRQQQIALGDFTPPEDWLRRMKKLCGVYGARRIVLLPTDALLLCGADLAGVAGEIQKFTGIQTEALEIAGMSSPNQWAGYDAALEALYRPYLGKSYRHEKSVNLVGWMWPSRHRGHEIGCCIDMLKELQIPVNAVISGGSSLADIEKSMHAGANALVCSSVMGNLLQRLDEEGIRLAGPRAPYGFSGTREWLTSIADVLELPVYDGIDAMEKRYRDLFEKNREQLSGKKVFVSGGPGSLIGLLPTLTH